MVAQALQLCAILGSEGSDRLMADGGMQYTMSWLYPLVSDGIIYDTIPPKMNWGDRVVPWGCSRGLSEALGSFPGSPGNKNRFFVALNTAREAPN